MPAPEIIHQLVAKFSENREAYRSGDRQLVYKLYGFSEEEIQIVEGVE